MSDPMIEGTRTATSEFDLGQRTMEAANGPDAAGAIDGPAASERWHFDWLDGPPRGHTPTDIAAHVTGRLRWRGVDLAFALDGVDGIDGRLSAPSVDLLPPPLQQVVLHHFADDCLRAMAHGPLADMALVAIEWHADPEPSPGQFAFTLRRPGVRAASHGSVSAFTAAGRVQLRDALAAAGWPVPREMATVAGRLRIGSVMLDADEVASLEPGDLIWIDDAEWSPAGLHAQFHADAEHAGCAAWLKRGLMTRDATPITALLPAAREAAAARLDVTSAPLTVERAWLQGALRTQRLHAPALAIDWQVCRSQHLLFEGRLLVVGRRLGLRVTRAPARPRRDDTPCPTMD